MKETTKTELKPETAAQAFRREVSDLKLRLPKDWKLRFIGMYPDYDSYRGGIILHHVINGNSTDMIVLEGLRNIVDAFEKEKAA